MIGHLKSLVRPFVPKGALSWYHRMMAVVAAWWYGNPSEQMIVIGVTGTKGKTTTSYLIAKMLEATGAKVGLTSTAFFQVGEREWLNTYKMTMLGRFALQRLLKQMVDAGCTYAVVETSSEGIVQHRHRGVAYDVAVLTNLTPEHIESHGSFENYRAAKGQLFQLLGRLPKKHFHNAPEKTAIINAAATDAPYFLDIMVPKQVTFAFAPTEANLQGRELEVRQQGSAFWIGERPVTLQLPGAANAWNVLAAVAACQAVGVDVGQAVAAAEKIAVVPGRFEKIDAGQPFTAIVDYAYEPESLRQLFATVKLLPHQRIIHVFGATGGGRDSWRRPVMGEVSASEAHISIVTTDDPYDDDPAELNKAVIAGMKGRTSGETVFDIVDRRAAIAKAVSLAQPGDLVLVTGKGNEQVMALAHGSKIPWDDRIVVAEEISKRISNFEYRDSKTRN